MIRAEWPQKVKDLESVILSSPLISKVLSRWDEMGLPDCWLVSGTVVQTFWNYIHGFPAEFGIEDIDLVYFDPADQSAETEASNERRICELLGNLNVTIDVKNQARVHIWYSEKFGFEIPPYESVTDAIECFPTVVGSIGLRPLGGGVEIFTAFGITDLYSLIVRPNKRQATQPVYEAKAARWKAKWPKLRIVDWSNDVL